MRPAEAELSYVEQQSKVKLTTTLLGTGKGNNYAYLVTDEPTKKSVIIDPANPPESVCSYHAFIL